MDLPALIIGLVWNQIEFPKIWLRAYKNSLSRINNLTPSYKILILYEIVRNLIAE